jgi:hypothetical protein
MESRMYFYKQEHFQAISIRVNNFNYRPGFKILLIELFVLEQAVFMFFKFNQTFWLCDGLTKHGEES